MDNITRMGDIVNNNLTISEAGLSGTGKCAGTLIPVAFQYKENMTSIDLINMSIIFPIQFAIGICGNLLNIVIMRQKALRTPTTTVLAAMAAADLGFFISMAIVKIRTLDIMRNSFKYYRFWVHLHVPLVGMANWFSAASIWLTIVITIERVIAVRFPLRVKWYLNRCTIWSIIIAIYMAGFLLSLHYFIGRKPHSLPVCNVSAMAYDDITITYRLGFVLSAGIRRYFLISHSFSVVFVVLFPLVIISGLNIVLVSSVISSGREREIMTKGVTAANGQKEDKVTRLAIIAICAYITFNVPSGVIHSMDMVNMVTSNHTNNVNGTYYNAKQTSNILVSSGKMINFILYFSGSSCFRQYFWLLARGCYNRIRIRCTYIPISPCEKSPFTSRVRLSTMSNESKANTAPIPRSSTRTTSLEVPIDEDYSQLLPTRNRHISLGLCTDQPYPYSNQATDPFETASGDQGNHSM